MEFRYLIIIVIIAIILIIVNISKHDFSGTAFEEPQREVGRYGEIRASLLIRNVLRDNDCLFTNVAFEYDNRPAELDCVVVNKYGVFIIEVKNYTGKIFGNEDDYEWKKYKLTDAGNVYEKNVKNPIKQVKRQVYLLAKYLDYYGVDVWVKGYALLMQGNSPVCSEYVLSSLDEIDKAIHTKDRTLLSDHTISKIKELIS